MNRWWISLALTVAGLGLALRADAQAPMPEPLPCGAMPPNLVGPPVPGPMGPMEAPPGPPANLGISAGTPGAFMNCPPCCETGCYAHVGAMALMRERLGHIPLAFVDKTTTNITDTGEVPLAQGFTKTIRFASDIDPNMAWG